MKRIFFCLLVACFCLGGVASAKIPEKYEVIVLRPPSGGSDANAKAINNNGEVVGHYLDGYGYATPVYWGTDRVPRAIAIFEGPGWGWATGINDGLKDGSYVVGFAQDTIGINRAFLWDASTGVHHDLGDLGGTDAKAYGINIHGKVAGLSWLAGSASNKACLFELNHDPAPLDPPGTTGGSRANDINDPGLAAGWFEGDAVIWDKGARQVVAAKGEARAVNNDGEVVGTYLNPAAGYDRGFIWDKFKGLRPLGTLGGLRSLAAGINIKGQVVGKTQKTNGDTSAFIWEEGSGMVDLNARVSLPTGLAIVDAFGINDRGEIVATAVNWIDLYFFACLLRPATAIPPIVTLLLGN